MPYVARLFPRFVRTKAVEVDVKVDTVSSLLAGSYEKDRLERPDVAHGLSIQGVFLQPT